MPATVAFSNMRRPRLGWPTWRACQYAGAWRQSTNSAVHTGAPPVRLTGITSLLRHSPQPLNVHSADFRHLALGLLGREAEPSVEDLCNQALQSCGKNRRAQARKLRIGACINKA